MANRGDFPNIATREANQKAMVDSGLTTGDTCTVDEVEYSWQNGGWESPWPRPTYPGGGVTLAVASGTPTAYTIPVSLVDPPAGLQTWDLEYKASSSGAWLSYATGLTNPSQSLADLDASTAYDFRAIGHVLVDATSNVGSATTDEAPPLDTLWTNQTGLAGSFASLNDGGIWFNAGGGARNFRARVINDSGRSATGMRLLLLNSYPAGTTAQYAIGYGGSNYDADTWGDVSSAVTLPASGAAGEDQPSVVAVDIVFPSPIANNGTAVISIMGPAAAAWSAASSFQSNANPSGFSSSWYIAQDGVTITGTWASGGIDLGMVAAGVQWKTVGNPVRRNIVFSDSRGAGEPPLVDGNPTLRESIWHGINTVEKANGTRFCFASFAEGGKSFNEFSGRLAQLTASGQISAVADTVFLDVLTWNQIPTSAGAAAAIWTEFLARQTALAALGIGCVPLVITPQGNNRQSAGQSEGWDYLAALVASSNGLNLAPRCADGTDPRLIAAAASADGVHLNSAFTAGSTYRNAVHGDAVACLTANGLL